MSGCNAPEGQSMHPGHSQHQPPPSWEPIAAMAVRCFSVVCRYLFAASALLVPASVVTATSCADLNCSTKCENTGTPAVNCTWKSTAECSSYSTCAVRTGCSCLGVSSSNPEPKGCNGTACYVAKDETQCANTIGCEWGDACDESVVFDCHTMDLDETACRQHGCSYYKDCG